MKRLKHKKIYKIINNCLAQYSINAYRNITPGKKFTTETKRVYTWNKWKTIIINWEKYKQNKYKDRTNYVNI
jgi:hypothetical protein